MMMILGRLFGLNVMIAISTVILHSMVSESTALAKKSPVNRNNFSYTVYAGV